MALANMQGKLGMPCFRDLGSFQDVGRGLLKHYFVQHPYSIVAEGEAQGGPTSHQQYLCAEVAFDSRNRDGGPSLVRGFPGCTLSDDLCFLGAEREMDLKDA